MMVDGEAGGAGRAGARATPLQAPVEKEIKARGGAAAQK